MVKDIMIVEKVPDVTFLKQYCFQVGVQDIEKCKLIGQIE